MAQKTAYLSLRLDPAVKEMLRVIVEKDKRSITKEVEYLIKKRYEELREVK